MITSLSNQKVKDLVKLREARFSRQSNLFIIEGFREVSLALEAKVLIKELYICRDFLDRSKQEKLLKQKNKLFEVSPRVYEKIAYGKRREGLIAIGQRPEHKLSDIKLSATPLLVVAEGIQKPGNLGAILRTIDASAVDGLVVADPGIDLYNRHLIRSSLGTVFNRPPVTATSKEILNWLKKNNITIVCAHPEGSSVYTSVDFRKPTALVVGSEEKGVSDFWRDQAEALVAIPMRGKADSLNVSVATAVLVFEALRQRS